MSDKQVAFTLRLPPALHRKVQALADKRKITVADYIRRCMENEVVIAPKLDTIQKVQHAARIRSSH